MLSSFSHGCPVLLQCQKTKEYLLNSLLSYVYGSCIPILHGTAKHHNLATGIQPLRSLGAGIRKGHAPLALQEATYDLSELTDLQGTGSPDLHISSRC
jgi:hypothetical protein